MTRSGRPSFDQAVEAHLSQWRQTHCATEAHGRQNDKTRPWILPAGAWEEGLWKELRQDGRYPLAAYLKQENIQKHVGVHNLKSSWVLCANLYWSFGQCDAGRTLLAGFLKEYVDSGIEEVTQVQLEWAGEGELSPLHLLGESGGQRGASQTSPDIAFFTRGSEGKLGVVLTENKFTEHSFYSCSARRADRPGRPGNPDRERCMRPLDVVADHRTQCHQHAWKRLYWERLARAADLQQLGRLTACPAAFAGYQLLRQQALAEALAERGAFDPVISCVAYDERNTELQTSLSSTGLPHFRDWGALFRGGARFCAFTHQNWFAWVSRHDAAGVWRDWGAYVGERYDFR